MSTYYLSSFGDDAADGSRAAPWRSLARLNRHLLESATPGDMFLFRAGETFPGVLEVPCPFPVSFGTYDGDTRAVIASGPQSGLSYYGTGGLTVQGLDFRGDGTTATAGINIASARVRHIAMEDCAASGYGMAGIQLMGELSDVTIRGCALDRNAVGLHVSGSELPDGTFSVRRLSVLDCTLDENGAIAHPEVDSVGLHIVGAEDVTIRNCTLRRTGYHHENAGSAILLWRCRRVVALFCQTSDTGIASPTDGQGFCADDSEDVVFSHCVSTRDKIGFEVHAEGEYPSRRVSFSNNVAELPETGLRVCGTDGDVWFTDNVVRTHSRDGVFRKAVDVSMDRMGTAGPVFFRGNHLVADDGAPLLQAYSLRHLHGWESNGWVSNRPRFQAGDREYASLAGMLSGEAVGVT